ncbi:uncharacterized protein LOC143179522 isoform X2 [Calliopsis andreniformis]|uniref:uncharacterized protein LOC143179522 isoform X2 n=1 Tax=Calliopsis andreniformis TaxID=337506 RepID=UPI003FCECB07
MYSREGTSEGSNHSSREVDDSEELNEDKPTSLENSANQFSVLSKAQDDLAGLKKFATIATQTPLTFISLTLTQSSLDKQFIDATTSPTVFPQESNHEANESRENAKPFPCSSVRNQVSIILSREAAEQATPLRPSVMHSISGTPRDTLQISTSLSSDKSETRNEILTVTTDYGTASPETRSILVDAIDRNSDRGLHLSVRNAYEPPPALDLALPRVELVTDNRPRCNVNHRRWSLTNCLRCISSVQDEVFNFVQHYCISRGIANYKISNSRDSQICLLT